MGVITPQCREAAIKNLRSGILEKHPRHLDATKLSYRGLHSRIVKLYGKADHCENIACEHPDYHRFEWANLDGLSEVTRETWAMLCVYCHRRMDKQGITPRLI
jgi:hypothetical protein